MGLVSHCFQGLEKSLLFFRFQKLRSNFKKEKKGVDTGKLDSVCVFNVSFSD